MGLPRAKQFYCLLFGMFFSFQYVYGHVYFSMEPLPLPTIQLASWQRVILYDFFNQASITQLNQLMHCVGHKGSL